MFHLVFSFKNFAFNIICNDLGLKFCSPRVKGLFYQFILNKLKTSSKEENYLLYTLFFWKSLPVEYILERKVKKGMAVLNYFLFVSGNG